MGLRIRQFRQGPTNRGDGLIHPVARAARCVFQPAQSISQTALRGVSPQRRFGPGNILDNLFGRLHQAALLIQLGIFARLRVKFGKFIHRMAQKVFFIAQRQRLRPCLLYFVLQRGPFAPRGATFGPRPTSATDT